MDLFTVPTASLRLLYGFFIIEHGRRRVVHFNATYYPTAAWVIRGLRDRGAGSLSIVSPACLDPVRINIDEGQVFLVLFLRSSLVCSRAYFGFGVESI
jgi:hypothetical protein